MESNLRVDFNYFNSAPVPYPFFGSTVDAQGLSPTEHYKHAHVNNDQFDPTGLSFQQTFEYEPSQYMNQPQSGHGTPAMSSMEHPGGLSMVTEPDPLVDSLNAQDLGTLEPMSLGRSSSEEKDNLTPQQNKRKAQNRAAQRAFRERKEKHVKELESRNSNLQYESINLQKEVESLRKKLAQANAQMNILQATSGSAQSQSTYLLLHDQEDLDSISVVHGYVPTDYPGNGTARKGSKDSIGKASNGAQAPFGSSKNPQATDDEDNLFDTGRTWDYIQNSELYRRGLVDVGDVCERLKNLARCDGKGPVYSERDIRRAITESSVAGGRDELL